jgi:hypothetical protein
MPLVASSEKIRVALDLFATGEALMRQQLRRRHPEWTELRLEQQLQAWLRERPGAAEGDAVGRPTNRLA